MFYSVKRRNAHRKGDDLVPLMKPEKHTVSIITGNVLMKLTITLRS